MMLQKMLYISKVLTEARVLNGISVVVVDLVTALALVANDTLGRTVTTTGLMVTIRRLPVTLTCCNENEALTV